MNENKFYTAKEALKEAWGYLQVVNAGHTDKVVMFYNISPYPDRDFKAGDGYINWFLSSSYSARNQILGKYNVRTCWFGSPPEKYFIDSVLKESVGLQERMAAQVYSLTNNYEYLVELDKHYATDEISGLEGCFQ